MEVFTDVKPESFLTGLVFQRPTGTKTGSELCIAVMSGNGQLLTAFYSVIVTLLFVVCWKLVSVVVMFFSDGLDEDPTSKSNTLRGMAVVGFWNAREPLEATCFTLDYLTRLIGVNLDEKPRIRSPAFGLLVLAVVWLLGTYAASILVAGQLIAGHVAPANPNEVYVPRPQLVEPADLMRLQAVRAPATLRSLGSAEASGSDHTIRKNFLFDVQPPSGGPLQYFTYNYTVTAHDMGLQKWHDLKQEVSGECNLNSSWLSENAIKGDIDVYRPWGLDNTTATVVVDGERKTAPSATAIPFPYADKGFFTSQAVEHRYGIIVHSSHRASHRVGTDPWYKTEQFTPNDNDTDARIQGGPGNRVMRGRPALSCKEKDVWSYNGRQFKNIFELTGGSGLNFPAGWATQLQLDFTLPRIIDVINSAGPSSLVSSSTFVSGRFDAQTSSIENDMKRLFTATWISSAHTFRNMLMVGNDQDIPNVALDKKEKPQPGVGLFVVSTPQVATLRLSVLVAIPALLAFFTLILWILERCAKRRDDGWYKNLHYAEGAYLFARTRHSTEFQKPESLDKVIDKCLVK